MSRKANKKVTWILWGLKLSKEEYSWLLYACTYIYKVINYIETEASMKLSFPRIN